MTKEAGARVPRDEEEIDLRELLGLLLDRKWWIIGTTLLCCVVGAVYALLATPVYRGQWCRLSPGCLRYRDCRI